MPDYDLGTAEGTVKIKYDGTGFTQAGGGLDDFSKKAKKAKDDFKDVAQNTGIAAGVIAGGIALAVNAAADFEARLSAIAAVSGATGDQLDELRKKALQLGADTVFSASDAAQAMEELAKAGLSTTDILNGAADATVALAAAGQISLPEAATIASNAMNQFQLAAEDLPHVADLIAGAANASAIDVNDFGLAMAQAGAVANLVGVNFDDLAAAIALMGNQGIKGSDAGTSLKTMLSNLIPTTAKQIELSKELGLITADGTNAFFDQEGHLKSLSEVAGILNTAMSGLTDEQKSLALQTLFGSDAIRAAAILANAGADGFNNMASAMAAVTAQDVAQKRMDNLNGSIEQLKGSVDTAAIAIGTALIPVIRKVTDFITDLVNRFSNLDPRWQKLIAFAAVAAAAILGLISVIAAVGAVIAGVAAAIGAWEIFAIIAAVVAAIAAIAIGFKALYDRSAAFRDLVHGIWTTVQQVFGGLVELLKPVVAWFRDTLVPAVQEAVSAFIDKLAPAFQAVKDAIEQHALPAFNKIKDALIAVAPTLKDIADKVISGLKPAFETLGTVIAFVWPIIAKIAGVLWDILGPAIAGLILLLPPLWDAFKRGVQFIMPLIDAFLFIAKIVFDVFKVVVDVISTTFDIIGKVFATIWDIMNGPIEAALGVVKALFEAAWAAIQAVVEIGMLAIKTAIALIDEYLVKPIREAWDKVTGFFNKAESDNSSTIGRIHDTIKDIMEKIKKIISDIWDDIKSIWQSAADRVTAITDDIHKIVDKVRDFFNELKTAASGGTDSFIDFVKGIPGRVLDALINFGSLLYQKGVDLIQGLINGITSKIGSIGNAMSSVMGAITDWLPGSPAEVGPLSGQGYVKFRGQHLTEDLAAGIISQAADAERAVQNVVNGISNAIPTQIDANVQLSRIADASASQASGARGGDTYNTYQFNVPLEDLRSIRDVQDLLDFIDRMNLDSQRGVETVAA